MIFYDIILFLVFLFYLPLMLIKGKGHFSLGERFGFIPPMIIQQLITGKNIWIHAVSVGEVFAVRTVINELNQRHPDKQVVLSVSTKTGHALAKEIFHKNVVLLWSPIDLSFVVRSFIQTIQPLIYIGVETEIWPNQFRLLAEHDVPSIIINGRISDKAWKRYQIFSFFFKSTLNNIDYFCVQSNLDAERFKALGAESKKVEVMNSIKWDDAPSLDVVDRKVFGFNHDDLIWVAGSTHPGEEEILVKLYMVLLKKYPKLKLVLVPRHVERVNKILLVIDQIGADVMCYSKNTNSEKVRQILLVDEMGVLKKFYAIADVVFVGKSLRVGGGHNIIEPAYLGKAIIVGPLMENFKEITKAFIDAEAVIQVKNEYQLEDAVRHVLDDNQYVSRLKVRLNGVIKEKKGATLAMLQHIDNLMSEKK